MRSILRVDRVRLKSTPSCSPTTRAAAGRQSIAASTPAEISSCVSQRPPIEPSSTCRYAMWSGISPSGQCRVPKTCTSRAPGASARRDESRCLRRVGVDPADGELDRASLRPRAVSSARPKPALIAIVDLERDDVRPEAPRGLRATERDRRARGRRAPASVLRASRCRRRRVRDRVARASRGPRACRRRRAALREGSSVVRLTSRSDSSPASDALFEHREQRARIGARAAESSARHGTASPSARSAAGVTSGTVDGQRDDDVVACGAQRLDQPVDGRSSSRPRRRRPETGGHRARRPCRRRAPRRRPRRGVGSRARRASRRGTARVPWASRSGSRRRRRAARR